MSELDPAILFEELTDEVNEDEEGAECGEVPAHLIELSIELEDKGTTPAEFMEAYGKSAPEAKKKAAKKKAAKK